MIHFEKKVRVKNTFLILLFSLLFLTSCLFQLNCTILSAAISIEKIIAEVYSGPNQTSRMKHVSKKANSFQPFSYFRQRLHVKYLILLVFYMHIEILEKKKARLSFCTVKLLISVQVCSGCANPT